jgi:phage shock protein A
MNGLIFIICFFVLLVVVAFTLNKPFRDQCLVKFRGRTESMSEADAQTVSGARDYYNAAIREKQEFASKASMMYAEISGKVDATKKDIYTTQKDIARITQSLNRCIDENNDNDAMAYAMKKQTAESKLSVLKDTLVELEEAMVHQKEVRDTAEEELNKLKEEKERTLYQMEADAQMIELHQSLDSLTSNNETDRMLEKVRDGAKKTRERAEGSRIAYDTSAQAADRRLERAEQDRNARQIVEELKRQRGK